MQAIESVHATPKRFGPVAQNGHWQNACPAAQTPPARFARNEEIYGEGEPSEFIYQVVSGAVRVYSVLSDGRRQIGAFYLPGDYFGFEAGDFRAMSAEAVTEARVRIVQRSSHLAVASLDPDLSRELWQATVRELQNARKHLVLLVRRAEERVASFLLEMAERTKRPDIELPMSRQDIADYLGLTIETVSRTLTHLEEAGLISLRSARRILLADRRKLEALNT